METNVSGTFKVQHFKKRYQRKRKTQYSRYRLEQIHLSGKFNYEQNFKLKIRIKLNS